MMAENGAQGGLRESTTPQKANLFTRGIYGMHLVMAHAKAQQNATKYDRTAREVHRSNDVGMFRCGMQGCGHLL